MGSLYERILGQHPTQGKLPAHGMLAAMGEWADGTLTGAQAQDIVTALGVDPLDAVGVQEAQDLVATVTSIAVTGGSAASNADGKARRALAVQKIERVFLLADTLAPGYDTPDNLRAKLGVPAR